MRLLLIFVLSCFVVDFGYCQGKNISIPVLKENIPINDLLDSILIPQNHPNSFNDEKPLADSCIVIQLHKGTNNIFFRIKATSREQVNISLNLTSTDERQRVGYFNYKRYKIFVVGDKDNFYGFFKPTKAFETFPFIYAVDLKKLSISDLTVDFKAVWNYDYKDGLFSRYWLVPIH
ncbi:MAG TPA: hypothetical protein VL442_11825 [Mucilaginibacter sp.]|jgi:hypothetical protein|nr:hypothetical protein [Mucilaginibacter sp.]